MAAIEDNIRGLERCVEHAWMERLLYEQEQSRAEQEAMAEIEQPGLAGSRPRAEASAEPTYNPAKGPKEQTRPTARRPPLSLASQALYGPALARDTGGLTTVDGGVSVYLSCRTHFLWTWTSTSRFGIVCGGQAGSR